MKVVISLHHRFELWQVPDWFVERLRKDFPSDSFTKTESYQELGEALVDAEAAIAFSIHPDQFAKAEKLKWIHSPAAAVHQLMFDALVKSGVTVTNSREVHGRVVAEHALALVLAMAKKIPFAVRSQLQKKWVQTETWEQKPSTKELVDAVVCVIGFGNIGWEFARRAQALGMKVIAVREHPEKGSAGADEVIGHADLKKVLPRADYVVLAAPLTGSTVRLMNEETIGLMKPDAYLINVSRGPLIDDNALVAALKAKKIAGAALDVFADEPLRQDSPYWEMENVLVTPHTAAVTDKLWERQYELISDNIRRYKDGRPLRGIVEKARGY